jgi:hypothetical protein
LANRLAVLCSPEDEPAHELWQAYNNTTREGRRVIDFAVHHAKELQVIAEAKRD